LPHSDSSESLLHICHTCCYFQLCGGRSPAIKMYENNSFESTTTKHCLLHRQALADTVICELENRSNQRIIDVKPASLEMR
jgi:sulfatase maturation enzyme AslB (radical SAM superfamily)